MIQSFPILAKSTRNGHLAYLNYSFSIFNLYFMGLSVDEELVLQLLCSMKIHSVFAARATISTYAGPWSSFINFHCATFDYFRNRIIDLR